MSKAKTIFKTYKEIFSLNKVLLPVVFINAFCNAAKPFVNVVIIAKIIDELTLGSSLKAVINYIIVALALNFMLYFLQNYLKDVQNFENSKMGIRQNQHSANKLFSVDYQKLQDTDYKDVIHKQQEAEKSRWAGFQYLTWETYQFVTGTVTLIISVIIIFPLLKIGFTKTGDTFFEKPIFLISLIVSIALMAVIILLISVKMNKSYLAANDAYAELDRLFYAYIDIFKDYRTGKEIRIYDEQELINHIATNRILKDGEKTLRKISMRTAKSSSVVAVLGAIVAFGVYLFIGVKGWYGLFSIGSLVMYCSSFMQIVNGIMCVANTLGKMVEIIPQAQLYFDIIEANDSMTYGDKEIDLSKFKIEFKDVSFKYPNANEYSLKNINLTINQGEHLAVVGKNGSGKTTFIKLLCRLYDATQGEILVNGINIKDYTKDSIVKLYSVVFQDFHMFALPVSSNICADDNYDKDRLYECLDNANIKDRILSMDKKEQTCLYKNTDKAGVEISGGEAQKLALARALYKDSPVVILDEPTAALDPVAENEIYTRFNSFVEGKTAIYISHRLSSCVFCSRIAVFEKGCLVETGTHETLLESGKNYAQLWNAQAQYYIQ